MIALNPQFITDNSGKKISVILPITEYDIIMEQLDDLEDVKLYDEAKKEDSDERILFSEYMKVRKSKYA